MAAGLDISKPSLLNCRLVARPVEEISQSFPGVEIISVFTDSESEAESETEVALSAALEAAELEPAISPLRTSRTMLPGLPVCLVNGHIYTFTRL